MLSMILDFGLINYSYNKDKKITSISDVFNDEN